MSEHVHTERLYKNVFAGPTMAFFCSWTCHDAFKSLTHWTECDDCGRIVTGQYSCTPNDIITCYRCETERLCKTGQPIDDFDDTLFARLRATVPVEFLRKLDYHWYCTVETTNGFYDLQICERTRDASIHVGSLIRCGVSAVVMLKHVDNFQSDYIVYARASPRRAQSAALLLLGATKYRALGLTRDTVKIVARLVWAQRYDIEWLKLDTNKFATK